MRIGDQAAILTLSRLASFGLLLLGPLLLVRLVPIEEFGRYREFVLYASLLQSFASFAIPDSLLYFIPAHPQSPWRIVRQTAILDGAREPARRRLHGRCRPDFGWQSRRAVPAAVVDLHAVSGEPRFLQEFLLIALRRPRDVMIYTALRLASRMIVAVGAAALTRSVMVIIWSARRARRIARRDLRLRLARDGSFFHGAAARRWLAQSVALPACRQGCPCCSRWRRRNIATVAVVHALGPAALAQFSIGK